MAKRFKAAIIGGSGYGGAEMARRLLMHPDVELVRVASIDHVGEPLGAVHPNLEGATDLVFEDLSPAEAAKGCDVALLALPHKVTAAKVPELIAAGVKIVDMSRRLPPARRRRLREVLRREASAPRAARHVRLRPARAQPRRDQGGEVRRVARLLRDDDRARAAAARARGLLDGAVVHVTGITGSSGSGIAPQAGTHHPGRAGNLRTYKPLEHQHVPEIVQTLADARRARTSSSASCRCRRR